jgi:hypothetical protein
MTKAQAKFLEAHWGNRSAGLPFKSPREAIILASIVEKETALPQERRHVASVFLNRLKIGMRLQTDPTVIYGLTRGYPLGRGIRQSELDGATPYNTYVIAGLPPGPICNPGKDSIAAVLNPEPSDVLSPPGGAAMFSPPPLPSRRAMWRPIAPLSAANRDPRAGRWNPMAGPRAASPFWIPACPNCRPPRAPRSAAGDRLAPAALASQPSQKGTP